MRARATCFYACIQETAQHARLGRWMSGIHWQQKAPKTEGLRGGETTRLPHTPPSPNKVSHAHPNQSGRQLKTISTSNG